MSWKNASVNRTKNVLDKNGVGVSFGGIPLPLHPGLYRRNKYLYKAKPPIAQRGTLAPPGKFPRFGFFRVHFFHGIFFRG